MEFRGLGQTGMRVSALGFGASALGGVFGPIDEAEGERTVHAALDHGINFLDVAPYYGVTKAETVLGRALRTVGRDRYHLATKVGQYSDDDFDYSAARVTASVDESLHRLGCGHIDLIQCHDIEYADLSQIVHETLPAMHRLKETGKVRHVGITGLPLKIFHAVLDQVGAGQVETILSFCHCELNDTSLLDLVPYLQEKNVGVISAAPTGMGLLTDLGGPPWHPAGERIQAGCRRAAEFCRTRGIDLAELAIQFAVAQQGIATTVVGGASSQQIIANIHAVERPLDEEKLAAVLDVLRPIHNLSFTRGRPENQDPLVA